MALQSNQQTSYWFEHTVKLAKPFNNPSFLLRNKQDSCVEWQTWSESNLVLHHIARQTLKVDYQWKTSQVIQFPLKVINFVKIENSSMFYKPNNNSTAMHLLTHLKYMFNVQIMTTYTFTTPDDNMIITKLQCLLPHTCQLYWFRRQITDFISRLLSTKFVYPPIALRKTSLIIYYHFKQHLIHCFHLKPVN